MEPLSNEEVAILQRGNDAERLLNDQTFLQVVDDLSQQRLAAIVHSRENDVEGRERNFRMIRGLQEIVAELQTRVAQRNSLLERRAEEQQERDEHPDYEDD